MRCTFKKGQTMAENKKFPTPEMLKAREAWAKKPESEKKMLMKSLDEEVKKYRESHFPIDIKRELEKSGLVERKEKRTVFEERVLFEYYRIETASLGIANDRKLSDLLQGGIFL